MPKSLPGYLRFVLPLMFTALLQPAAAAEPYPPTLPQPDRFNRLAMALSEADAGVRVDFALIAVTEMVLAHREEADRARRDAHNSATGRNPARWARAVDAYAADLTAVVNGITTDTQVNIDIGPENNVALNIDGRPVMVNFPQTPQQAVFEQRVMERFCNRHPCENLIAEYQQTQPSNRYEPATPVWRFSQQGGPVCATADGLEFHFHDAGNLNRKRQACRRLVAELNTLAELIAENRAAGVRIDWNRLAIHRQWEKDQHLVEIDSAGGAIRVSLPALASAPQLLAQVRPWLAAKVEGIGFRQVVIDGDRVMVDSGVGPR